MNKLFKQIPTKESEPLIHDLKTSCYRQTLAVSGT